MRKSDFVTIFRIFLVFVSFALLYFNDLWGLILIPIAFFLDSVDGFLARREEEKEYGKRLDVAGDRITEYFYYLLFTVKGLIPIFVFPIIITRNSLVDTFFYTPKKNFSTTKTALARFFSSSRFSRFLYGFLKAVTFFYLGCVLLFSFPIIFGYILVAIIVIFSVIRGTADILESFS